MPDQVAAKKAVRAAQRAYKRDSERATAARRKAFKKAHKDGLSLSEIGELVGLHKSRIGQILEGE